MDFTQILPNFINLEIFFYLDPKTYYQYRSVSKSWKRIVTPYALKSVMFCSPFPEREEFLRFCNNYGDYITTLSFFGRDKGTSFQKKEFVKIITTCKNIRALKVDGRFNKQNAGNLILELGKTQRNFNHLTLRFDVTKRFMNQISKVFKNLESLDIFMSDEATEALVLDYDYPKVKILTLENSKTPDLDRFGSILSKFPNLKLLYYLGLSGYSGCHSIWFKISPDSFHLTDICFSGFDHSGYEFSFDLSSPQDKASLNRAINLLCYFQSNIVGLKDLLQNLPAIRKSHMCFPERQGLLPFAEALPMIAKSTSFLFLMITDINPYLHLEFPHVEFLKLGVFSEIQGSALGWIASRFPSLKELNIQFEVDVRDSKCLSFPHLTCIGFSLGQPMEFWETMVSFSPNLKFFYLSKFSSAFSQLEAKFKTARVIHYRDDGLGGIYTDLSGFSTDSKELIDQQVINTFSLFD